MKDTILGAAIEVIALHGLNNWTVEEVANRAHCAKGLINYHYRSKQALLKRAAETLRDDRSAHRLAAIQAPGSQALDRLWTALVEEVESGWFAAWISLLAADDPLRKAAAERPVDTRSFASALSKSLGLGDELVSQAALIKAGLDGLQLRLLQGAPAAETGEAYHRFWLTVVA
ncbi:MAG TPA: helix-turn-helix domain-containing protein [Gemmatimonadales bacterium]|jgi:AcrR family transcriptional regulator|nr:helix-turn-helix domain-containing protein [Gemmatimonadales bacterium]